MSIYNLMYSVNPCGDYNDPITITGVHDRIVSKLTIPSHIDHSRIENIHKDAFSGMTNLKEVEIDDSLLRFYECFRNNPTIYNDWRQRYKEWIKAQNLRELKYSLLPAYADSYESLFIGLKNIGTVVIPNGVKNITCAFADSSVERIIIPESVFLMDCALARCENLKEIIIECAYDRGALFGGCDNDNVESVICFSDSPTIIGYTPNAAWYVPYNSIKDYDQALEEFPKKHKCNAHLHVGCNGVLSIGHIGFFKGYDYESKLIAIVDKKSRFRLEEESHLGCPIGYNHIQASIDNWQLTDFGYKEEFVICNLKSGEKIDDVEPIIDQIATKINHERNFDWDSWCNKAKVRDLIGRIIGPLSSLQRLLLPLKPIELPGFKYAPKSIKEFQLRNLKKEN